MDNVIVYVYDGAVQVGGEYVAAKNVARFEPGTAEIVDTETDAATVDDAAADKDGAKTNGSSERGAVLTIQVAPDARTVDEDTGHGTGHAAKLMLFAGMPFFLFSCSLLAVLC